MTIRRREVLLLCLLAFRKRFNSSTEEQIKSIFDDSERLLSCIIHKKKPFLWVFIQILMSSHNIDFNEEMAKIIFQLSLNMIKFILTAKVAST